jgi:hypothetical protein
MDRCGKGRYVGNIRGSLLDCGSCARHGNRSRVGRRRQLRPWKVGERTGEHGRRRQLQDRRRKLSAHSAARCGRRGQGPVDDNSDARAVSEHGDTRVSEDERHIHCGDGDGVSKQRDQYHAQRRGQCHVCSPQNCRQLDKCSNREVTSPSRRPASDSRAMCAPTATSAVVVSIVVAVLVAATMHIRDAPWHCITMDDGGIQVSWASASTPPPSPPPSSSSSSSSSSSQSRVPWSSVSRVPWWSPSGFRQQLLPSAANAHGRRRIVGSSELDFAKGLGAAHAYDRLVQLMLVRAIARGELASTFRTTTDAGPVPSAAPYPATPPPAVNGVQRGDTMMARLGGVERVAVWLRGLPKRERRLLEAYAAGINHVLTTEPLPLELVMFMGEQRLAIGTAAGS